MDLKNFWFDLLVTEAHLNAIQAAAERAIRFITTDLGLTGVYSGLAVAEKATTPNLSVDVAAGVAYSTDGERLRVPSTQNVAVDEDSDGTPTAVSGVGNEKWVAVFIRFVRAESEPFVDGNSQPGNFTQDESYEWLVVQGAEALVGAAARPALVAGAVLLADVKLIHNQTSVLNADISTTRRQSMFSLSGTPNSIVVGTVTEAIQAILDLYNDHVTGAADRHDAADVDYAGGATWADGTTNPATTAEVQLDKIFTDLGAGAGSAKIAANSFTQGVVTMNETRLDQQVTALVLATRHHYAGGGTWADGTTNPAATSEAQFDKIISELAATSASGGLAKVGSGARTAWLGGRTNPAATSFAALDKVITDLSAQTAGDDGMERVGGESRSGSPDSLAAGSAASQTTELLGFVNNRVRVGTKTVIQLVEPELVNDPAQVELASVLSDTVHGATYYAPAIVTAAPGGASEWSVVYLDLPRGVTLASVELETAFIGTTLTGATTATYDVFRWKVTTSGLTIESLVSGGPVADDHTLTGGGANYTSIRTQTVTCNQNNTIDIAGWRYGLRLTHPYGAISGDMRLRIHEVRLVY